MAPDTANQTRLALRRKLRRNRAGLDSAERKRATQSALERLVVLSRFRRAKRIALYFPVGSELDVSPLFDAKATRSKRLFLPVLATGQKPYLRFAACDRRSAWKPNRYGIPEPLANARALFSANQLDLVIVPLVGFDKDLNRIGAGGGFYDRTFAYRLSGGAWHRPKLIGIAFECQRVEALQSEPWDVPLDAIVTDVALYRP